MKLPLFIASLALFSANFSNAQEVASEVRVQKLSDYDRLIVATCLILEASSEGEAGMQAVLNVIHNRSNGDLHKLSSEIARHGQFTAMSPVWGQAKPNYGPLMRRAMNDRNFSKAVSLVRQLEQGELTDLTGGSTHYHKDTISPNWSRQMAMTTQIGVHRFYRRESLSTQ